MNYNEFPIIQMKTALEQEEWFKLADGTISVNRPEAVYLVNGGVCNEANLSISYKDVTCAINLFNYRGKTQVKIMEPKYCNGRSQRTASVPKAIKIVRDKLIYTTEKIDSELVRQAEAERVRKIMLEQRDDVIKRLGGTLTTQVYNEFGLCFKMSKKHKLLFSYTGDPGKEVFHIQTFNGEYGMTAIKKLIDYLSECPEAVTERLLNGK